MDNVVKKNGESGAQRANAVMSVQEKIEDMVRHWTAICV